MVLRFEPLSDKHDLSTFDSGEHSLDHWLRRHAHANQTLGSSRTFVAVDQMTGVVVGYYSLTVGAVDSADSPATVVEGMPAQYPIPVVILARLAVDQKHQRNHVGTALLGDAILRSLQVAENVGVRALLVHTLNEKARQWYLGVAEFEPSPTHERHLMLPIKDIEAADLLS